MISDQTLNTENIALFPWLRLHHTDGLSATKALALLDHFGSMQGLVQASRHQLESLSLKPATLNAWLEGDEARIEADLRWLEGDGCHIVTLEDPRYPERLKMITDPPLLLYIQGDPSLLSDPQLAVVGSRNPSRGGSDNAFEFSRHLSGIGLTITSGLALGIDGASHRGALEGLGKTIAVVGTGLDRVYPAQHRELAHQIADQGALVSAFAVGTPPLKGNFPRRNRMISGLSVGTLVVEAALKSGSLITARLAMEQGREVFAIPGSIHNPLARGCHRLIREGAKLVESSEDILEELAPLLTQELVAAGEHEKADQAGAEAEIGPELDSDYRTLLDNMGYDPIAVDEMVARSGLTAEAVSSMLLVLELQGIVEATVGGHYIRCKGAG